MRIENLSTNFSQFFFTVNLTHKKTLFLLPGQKKLRAINVTVSFCYFRAGSRSQGLLSSRLLLSHSGRAER